MYSSLRTTGERWSFPMQVLLYQPMESRERCIQTLPAPSYCIDFRETQHPHTSYDHRRTGRGVRGAVAPPPPIRAVCRHLFGQRVDIILELTETNSATTSPPHRIWSGSGDHGTFLPLPPPPIESGRLQTICVRHSGKTRFDPPPKWMLARTPMLMMRSFSCCLAMRESITMRCTGWDTKR